METDIIKFIKGEIFGIMISTNKKLDHCHETVVLAYTHNDKFIGRDGEFHQSHGGYKSNIILLPKTDLNFVLKDETVKLFRNVKDYENYLKTKFNNDSKLGCVSENIDEYDPKHMYHRYINLGTCVREAQNFNNWEFECNGIKLNGFSIQDPENLSEFGYIIDFEDINNVRDKLISGKCFKTDDVNNVNDKFISSTLNHESEQKLKNNELEKLKTNISRERAKVEELSNIINKDNEKIQDCESTINCLKDEITKLKQQNQKILKSSKIELKNTQKNCESKLKRQTLLNQQLIKQISELQTKITQEHQNCKSPKSEDKSQYLIISQHSKLILTICILILLILFNCLFI